MSVTKRTSRRPAAVAVSAFAVSSLVLVGAYSVTEGQHQARAREAGHNHSAPATSAPTSQFGPLPNTFPTPRPTPTPPPTRRSPARVTVVNPLPCPSEDSCKPELNYNGKTNRWELTVSEDTP